MRAAALAVTLTLVAAGVALAAAPRTGTYRGTLSGGGEAITGKVTASGAKRYIVVTAALTVRCPSGTERELARTLHPGRLRIGARRKFGYSTTGRSLNGAFNEAGTRATGTLSFSVPLDGEICTSGRRTFTLRR